MFPELLEHIDGKYLHIPINKATVANDGDVVYKSRYWKVIKKGFISIYIGNSRECKLTGQYRTYSPQCNKDERIMGKVSEGKSLYIPIVFLADRLQSETI